MDPTQEQFERAVADEFFGWFNIHCSTNYAFSRRGDEAPDLVYADRGNELGVEITAGYYDAQHGAFLWKGARGQPDAPEAWCGVEPDKSLAQAVIRQISAKSQKRYGARTILVINVPPGVTSFEELSGLLSRHESKGDIPFAGVYVCGRFPITSSSAGGYCVIAIKDLVN